MASTVKLLLTESIRNVGRVGDVVEVSAGFARNHLLPARLAVQPTPGNVKKIEARRQEIDRMEREKRSQQEQIIQRLAGVEVNLERKTNDQGHLYGAVSATDIAHALGTQGFPIEASDVNLPGRLDHVDSYIVKLRLAEDLVTDIKVWVNPDADSKAAIDAAHKAAATPAEPEA